MKVKDSVENFMVEASNGDINSYGARYDYIAPFEMFCIHLPPYRDLPPVPIPEGIQISVCIPLYNRAKIIELSLKSILLQQFPKEAYEIIFIDDASTDNTKEVLSNICQKYSEYNVKAIFRERTTTFNDTGPLNVAFREAKGQILMLNQIDLLHAGNVLEATWRHHNARNNLWLCPKSYYMSDEYSPVVEEAHNLVYFSDLERMCFPQEYRFFPHERAASIRREHIVKVRGRDEGYIGDDSGHIDFMARLMRLGIVCGEDPTIAAIHRSGIHPPRRREEKAITPRWNPDTYTCNTDGDWGALSENEHNSMLRTR